MGSYSADLTREQEAVNGLMQHQQALNDLVIDESGRELNYPANRLLPFMTAFNNAVTQFGRTELLARQAERYREVGREAEAEQYQERYTAANDRGIELLEAAQDGLDEFRTEVERGRYPEFDDEFEAELEQFQDGIRDVLVDIDLKASDIAAMEEELSSIVDTVTEEGVEGFVVVFDDRLSQLHSARRSPGRGADGNLPWYKLLAIAAYLGISIWALAKCRWRWFGKRCTIREKIIYTVGARLIGWLIKKFC